MQSFNSDKSTSGPVRLGGRHVTGSFESSFCALREEAADVALRIRSGSLSPEPENKEVTLRSFFYLNVSRENHNDVVQFTAQFTPQCV